MTNHDDFTGHVRLHFADGKLIRLTAERGSYTGRIPPEIVDLNETLAFLVRRADLAVRQAAEKSYFARRDA